MMAAWIICYCFAFFLIFNRYPATAKPTDGYPTANLSSTWNNTDSDFNPVFLGKGYTYDFSDGTIQIRTVLLGGSLGPTFACCFYCNGNCTSYLFAVFIVKTVKESGFFDIDNYEMPISPQVVWSANRDSPVRRGAILNFTATGELVLEDVDGSTVWTTNTTGKSVVGMNLTDSGNLVLFDVNGSVVWQSFDHPRDCLVPGQRLFQGRQLIPSVSSTDWTAQKGLFSFHVTYVGLAAYVGTNPPQVYYQNASIYGYTKTKRKYVRFLNGSLSFFFSSDELGSEQGDPYDSIQIPFASSAQYMKFMSDGHLKVFEWKLEGWSEVADLLTSEWFGECTYPLACGRNDICSNKQECSCPDSSPHTIDYFRAVNDRLPNLGCSAVTPHVMPPQILLLQNITFSDYPIIDHFQLSLDSHTYMKYVSIERCKQACLNRGGTRGGSGGSADPLAGKINGLPE